MIKRETHYDHPSATPLARRLRWTVAVLFDLLDRLGNTGDWRDIAEAKDRYVS
jgi:hypothetical protein